MFYASERKKITLMMSDDRQRLISPFYFPLVYFVWFKAYNYIFTHRTTHTQYANAACHFTAFVLFIFFVCLMHLSMWVRNFKRNFFLSHQMLLFYYNNKGDKSNWTRTRTHQARKRKRKCDKKAQFQFIEKLKCNI